MKAGILGRSYSSQHVGHVASSVSLYWAISFLILLGQIQNLYGDYFHSCIISNITFSYTSWQCMHTHNKRSKTYCSSEANIFMYLVSTKLHRLIILFTEGDKNFSSTKLKRNFPLYTEAGWFNNFFFFFQHTATFIGSTPSIDLSTYRKASRSSKVVSSFIC